MQGIGVLEPQAPRLLAIHVVLEAIRLQEPQEQHARPLSPLVPWLPPGSKPEGIDKRGALPLNSLAVCSAKSEQLLVVEYGKPENSLAKSCSVLTSLGKMHQRKVTPATCK